MRDGVNGLSDIEHLFSFSGSQITCFPSGGVGKNVYSMNHWVYLDEINTSEKLITFLDDVSTVGWIASKLPQTSFHKSERQFCDVQRGKISDSPDVPQACENLNKYQYPNCRGQAHAEDEYQQEDGRRPNRKSDGCDQNRRAYALGAASQLAQHAVQ